MTDLQKNINHSQITLEKAKELINQINMENSSWINLGVKQKDVVKAEILLKDIQKEIGKIAESSIEAIPSNNLNDETVSFLNDSIHIAFFDLNKIYNDIKNIKKNIKTRTDQRSNVERIDKHFKQFTDDYEKIKNQLEQVLVSKRTITL